MGIEAGIEFKSNKHIQDSMKEVLAQLNKHKKNLLLIDEVQVLAKHEANQTFIAALRTVLDTNKDNIKVIFTGSSQAGLHKMFSKADAPFFHFGQNLPFPKLDRGFTDHLADVFKVATKRSLNKTTLWKMFIELQKVPQLIRALVERMALNPGLSITHAKQLLLKELVEDREYIKQWDSCSSLERLLLVDIAQENYAVFSEASRQKLAHQLDIKELTVPRTQSAIRSLQRKEIISRLADQGGYIFDDPNFERWLEER